MHRLLACSIVSVAALTAHAAPTAAALFDVLTCGPRDSAEAEAAAKVVLDPSRETKPDGPSLFAERVVRDGACVENVTIAAAFGSLSAFGKVCGSGAAALLRVVKQRNPALAAQSTDGTPGMLARLAAKDFELFVYRGNGEPGQAPDPKSTSIAFACSLRPSGAQ
jgi:phage tail tape-measure protein